MALRLRLAILIFLLGLLFIFCLQAQADSKEDPVWPLDEARPKNSLIPLEQQISDQQTRLIIARTLVSNFETRRRLLQAREQLQRLQVQGYAPELVEPLLLQVQIRLGQRQAAISMAHRLKRSYAQDPSVLAEIADDYARLGLYRYCRETYSQALEKSPARARPRLSLRLADKMSLWGEFYAALSRYKDWLQSHPDDLEIRFKLARTLAAAQRYIAAKDHLQEILAKLPDQDPQLQNRTQLSLVRLEIQRKDYRSALTCLDALPLKSDEVLYLRVQALRGLNRDRQALGLLRSQIKEKGPRAKTLLEIGKTCLSLGKDIAADKAFAAAHGLRPKDAEISFFALGPEEVSSPKFVHRLEKDKDCERLMDWAVVYAQQGLFRPASNCYQAVLDQWPLYFPAKMGLAQVLASNNEYGPSLDLLRGLRSRLPESDKVALTMARVLGWSKQYERSLQAYQEILGRHPQDVVARREMARTAYWAKENELADRQYQSMLDPATDELLAKGLRELEAQFPSPSLESPLAKLIPKDPKKTVYRAYARLKDRLEAGGLRLSNDIQTKLQGLVQELEPTYELQRQVWLEYQAKSLAWDKRFIPAQRRLQRLITVEPGNEEARFDQAQVQCALGLCDLEAKTYARLLQIDPLHSLAKLASKRADIRASPKLDMRYRLWDETGRGELSQITRQSSRMSLDIPIDCRNHLQLWQEWGIDTPKRHANSVSTQATGIKAEFKPNESLSTQLALGYKGYQSSPYPDLKTGHLGLTLNAWGLMHLNLLAKRENVLHNAYALEQGIQADTLRLALDSNLNRHLSTQIGGEYISYNDANSGVRADAALGLVLNEHPREFKVTLSGEYRNTHEQSQELGSPIRDINHPYWTPQDYLGTALILDWRHDRSRFHFCGSQRNIYGLQLSLGTNTDSNPSVELKGIWELDFLEYWSLDLEAMIHESREWDAHSLSLGVSYRIN